MTLTRITVIAFAGALSIAAFSAVASDYAGNLSEVDQAKVKESVLAQGYELKRMEMEDGEIEVYATKDGVKYELYLDNSFNIIRTEQDD